MVLSLKEALQSDVFGELTHLHLQRHAPKPAQITDADILQDTAVHDIDLAAFILEDQPLLVSSHLQKRQASVFDDISLVMQQGSVHINIEAHWMAQERIRQLVATTTNARFVLDLVTRRAEVWTSHAISRPLGNELWNQTRELYKGFAYDVTVVEQEPLRAEIVAVLDAYQKGVSPPMTMLEAFYPLDVVSQALDKNI